MKLFGLIIFKKKDVINKVNMLMEENKNKEVSQYWQGYEDGCDNICNWIKSRIK